MNDIVAVSVIKTVRTTFLFAAATEIGRYNVSKIRFLDVVLADDLVSRKDGT